MYACFTATLRDTKLWNLACLTLRFNSHLVGHPPPQLDGLNLLAFVSRMPNFNRLCDASALLSF